MFKLVSSRDDSSFCNIWSTTVPWWFMLPDLILPCYYNPVLCSCWWFFHLSFVIDVPTNLTGLVSLELFSNWICGWSNFYTKSDSWFSLILPRWVRDSGDIAWPAMFVLHFIDVPFEKVRFIESFLMSMLYAIEAYELTRPTFSRNFDQLNLLKIIFCTKSDSSCSTPKIILLALLCFAF